MIAGQGCFAQKCKENATTGEILVLESLTGLEGQGLEKKDKKLPPALDAVAAKVCALYPRRDVSIWKREGQERWMKWSRPLDASQILGVMSDEGRGLYRGCHWSSETRHGVIDVDINSRYHSIEGLAGLIGSFLSIGLPLVPYQSSNSGGWHLYFFLNDWANSAEVESTIKTWLKSLGYVIQSGTLEVFPSGNALRLPMQQGFAWLSPDGQVRVKREEISRDEALGSFLTNLQENKRNWQLVKSRIESQLSKSADSAGAGVAGSVQDEQDQLDDEGFEGLFRGGLDWEKYQRGRDYWLTGLTDKSQRHDAVICIGHYLWYGDKASGLCPLPHPRNAKAREAKIQTWLEAKHNGQSREVNAGAWRDIAGQITRATAWTRQTPLITEKHEPYPLTDRLVKRLEWLYQKTGKLWTIQELEKANIDRSLEARNRIAIAVAQIEAEGAQLSKAAVARKAKAHWSTVAKHSDLLTCSLGVNNGGLGGRFVQLGILGSSLEHNALDPVPCSGESTASFPGLRSVSVLSAEAGPGRRRTTDGRQPMQPTPPPPRGIESQGSISGFGVQRYACGISSLALFIPVILSGLIVLWLLSVRIRHDDRCFLGSVASDVSGTLPIKADSGLILRGCVIAEMRGPPGR